MRVTVLVLGLLAVPVAAEEWRTEQRDVEIPMRDGAHLAADVWLPPREGRVPAVLIQTPYNKAHLGAPIGGEVKEVGEVGRGAVSDTLGLLDREHYAYVVVDWRGFYGSKAAMEGVRRRGWRRGMDGYDCVEWVASQPWSDGKVGTWGGSALGKQQLDTAAEKPPHLACCVPLIAAMGQRYDFYYENGCYLEAHVKTLDVLGYDVSKRVLASPRADAAVWRLAEEVTYHPERIEVPCLMISGWWDHYPDRVIETFEDISSKGGTAAREHSKLLLGPWDHVGVGLLKQGNREFKGAELESARSAKAFFDRWLRDEDNGWDKTPRVRYWTVNGEGWTSAESWTGIKRTETALHLCGDGTISAVRPAESPARGYTCDPSDPTPTIGGANLPPVSHGPKAQDALDARKDLLAWSTAKLAAPLALNGNARLEIEVEVDRPCCDFMARLCDVSPEGKAYLLADAAIRLSDAKPGEKASVTLRFPALAATFPEGWRLRVYLSSTNWPRYERNPNTGAAHWGPKEAVPVVVKVLQPATLVLPGAVE